MKQEAKPGGVDLAEVTRLVETLERDLAKVRAGSTDIETLRGEVEQLRAALHRAGEDHADLQHRLTGVRALLHRLEDEIVFDALTASDYIARIGRMLGM